LGCFSFLVTLKCIDCSQLEHSVLFVSPTMIAQCLQNFKRVHFVVLDILFFLLPSEFLIWDFSFLFAIF
jgi:hypothetical protein